MLSFSIAVLKHWPKETEGGEGLPHLTAYSSSLWEVNSRTPAGTEVEHGTAVYWLALQFVQPAFLHNTASPTQGWGYPHGLGQDLPTSIMD